jgi:hypothetical protein
MARQRKLSEERKKLINQLLATYKPEDAGDVHSTKLYTFLVVKLQKVVY